MGQTSLDSDQALRELVAAIVAADSATVGRLISESPQCLGPYFGPGASRASAHEFFVEALHRCIVAGDTALHLAAAGYKREIANQLIAAGANVHARNRFGDQPLHAAAKGGPGSPHWNPSAQSATIACLVEASAVRTLLDLGADPTRTNKNGSTPTLLGHHNTGRGGTGSPEAKAQQQEIVRLLQRGSPGI